MIDNDVYAKIANNLDPDGDVMKMFVECIWLDRTMYKLNFRECDEVIGFMGGRNDA
jgi:hypothetical protein